MDYYLTNSGSFRMREESQPFSGDFGRGEEMVDRLCGLLSPVESFLL